MPKHRDDASKSRLYSRRHGKTSPARYYADFRDFDHVGGKQEPLAPPGSARVTREAGLPVLVIRARRAGRTVRVLDASAAYRTSRAIPPR